MKRLTGVLFFILAILCIFGADAFAADVLPGDVNGDGAVNSIDASYLLRHSILPDTYPLNQSADMDGNGAVNSMDASYLLRHSVLPEAYPLKNGLDSCSHEVIFDLAKEPSCAENGLTEGRHCRKCGMILTAQEVIPALGHDYEDGKCTVCGANLPVSEGLLFTLSEDGARYTVSGMGDCKDKDIRIPAEFAGLPVEAIAPNAFEGNTALRSLVLPSSIVRIGERAFAGCSALSEINMSYALKYIGAEAFRDCISLTHIEIPEGITDIEANTFSGCQNLASAFFSEKLLMIDAGAFRDCTALTQITYSGYEGQWRLLGKDIGWDENTGEYTLVYQKTPRPATNLLFSLSADGSYYTVLGLGNCTEAEFIIPAVYNGLPVLEIGLRAFYDCDTVIGITLENGLRKIGAQAFENCARLLYADIAESVSELGERAFADCAMLERVSLPNGLTALADGSFYGCYRLEYAPLPSSLVSLGSHAFDGTAVSEVLFPNTLLSIGGHAFANSIVSEALLPEGLLYIGDHAFASCNELKTVRIPDSVRSIGKGVFQNVNGFSLIYGGSEYAFRRIEKSEEWNLDAVYTLTYEKYDENINGIRDPVSYQSDYAYRYLGTLDKGSSLQALYREMDGAAYTFHTTNADAQYLHVPNVVSVFDYTSMGLTSADADVVWAAYRLDHPLYYWIARFAVHMNGSIYFVAAEDYQSGAVRSAYNEKIYDKIALWTGMAEGETSAYQIALAYHDLIVSEIDYAYENDGTTPEDASWAQNIIGVLCGMKKGICESYAKTFQLLLNYSGIENVYVNGEAGGGHSWNLVRFDDGNWYWCDLTWDDTPSFALGISHRYFGVNSTQNLNFLAQDGDRFIDNDGDGVLDHLAFTDEHIPSFGGYDINFMYPLPDISQTQYQGNLREIFGVNGMQYAVSGFRTVQFVYTEKTGDIEIPETVRYQGITYRVNAVGGIREDGIYTKTEVAPFANSVSVPKTVVYIWDGALD